MTTRPMSLAKDLLADFLEVDENAEAKENLELVMDFDPKARKDEEEALNAIDEKTLAETYCVAPNLSK